MASLLSLCLLALTTAVCMIASANANALPFSTNGGRNLYLGPDKFVVRGINYSCVHSSFLNLQFRSLDRGSPQALPRPTRAS
jgi:hypothetical protein